jgi:PAS domain S-box-containing protein
MEAAGDPIIVMQRSMRVCVWNRAAEQLFGWDRREVLGAELPTVSADLRDELYALMEQVLNSGEVVASYETARLTRDGRLIPVLLTLSPVRNESDEIVGVMSIIKDVSTLKTLEEQRKAAACLEEREMIAMDLHDNTIQTLHGAVLNLALAERMAQVEHESVRDALRRARVQLNTGIKELRAYLVSLRPGVPVARGLTVGLALLRDQARLSAQLQVELQVDDKADMVIPQQGTRDQLLAIAREATSNVIRHAHARVLRIDLAVERSQAVLVICDDGCGFDQRETLTSTGSGLRNMAERARIIGAELSVTSRPAAGTEIRVETPLMRDQQLT